jgi:RNA binding exosome subunit
MKITKLNIRTFVNVTEDLERVFHAIFRGFPILTNKTSLFTQKKVEGHYGNPIILVEASIKDKETLKEIIRKIGSKLTEQDKDYLRREGHQHIEKGKLFMRLDKQSAYLGKVKLGSSDSIHLKFFFRKSRDERPNDIYKEFWDA